MYFILRDKMMFIVLFFEKCFLCWIKRKFLEFKEIFFGGLFGEGFSGLFICM